MASLASRPWPIVRVARVASSITKWADRCARNVPLARSVWLALSQCAPIALPVKQIPAHQGQLRLRVWRVSLASIRALGHRRVSIAQPVRSHFPFSCEEKITAYCLACANIPVKPWLCLACCLLVHTGRYCAVGSSVAVVCPPGNFCPLASPVPTVCPVGTYNENTGQSSAESGCLLCRAGYTWYVPCLLV
jgi:hypothetical protein